LDTGHFLPEIEGLSSKLGHFQGHFRATWTPVSGVLGFDLHYLCRFSVSFMIDEVRLTRCPNGITVLTEHMPGLRSVTAGIWVRRGSRHESPELNGICHFIEHAVFKGTKRRTARDIAVESDRLGGNLDAFTTHEMTGFAELAYTTRVSF
jgi:hypothetical protein